MTTKQKDMENEKQGFIEGRKCKYHFCSFLLQIGEMRMPNYGFARCSLGEEKGQDLNRQIRELKAAGADEIITERVHGDAKVKPQLQFLLEHIEANSTLYVTEVSRLSRSTQQLCEILGIIKEKHLRLVILNSVTIDCRNGEIDPMSMAFLQMAGVFSELELAMIRNVIRPFIRFMWQHSG